MPYKKLAIIGGIGFVLACALNFAALHRRVQRGYKEAARKKEEDVK